MKYPALPGKIQYCMLNILENDGLMVSYKLPILDVAKCARISFYFQLFFCFGILICFKIFLFFLMGFLFCGLLTYDIHVLLSFRNLPTAVFSWYRFGIFLYRSFTFSTYSWFFPSSCLCIATMFQIKRSLLSVPANTF